LAKILLDKYKDKIKNILSDTIGKWEKLYSMTATPKLKHWMINKYIKENIPEIN